MVKKDAFNLRLKIHSHFGFYFSVSKSPYSDGYFLIGNIDILPSNFRSFVRSFGVSEFHFNNGKTIIGNLSPKSKIIRLYSLQNRLDSIIKDFRDIPDVSQKLLIDLNRIYVILDKCIFLCQI